MGKPTHRWADELTDTVGAVRTLRDELRVQLHLASMEAKARFTQLEHRLETEQLAARKNFKELVEGFREVKEELTRAAKDGRPGARH